MWQRRCRKWIWTPYLSVVEMILREVGRFGHGQVVGVDEKFWHDSWWWSGAQDDVAVAWVVTMAAVMMSSMSRQRRPTSDFWAAEPDGTQSTLKDSESL
jgi:hypothetical protein